MTAKPRCANCHHELIDYEGMWIHKHGFIPNRVWCAVPFQKKYAYWDDKQGSWFGTYCGCKKPQLLKIKKVLKHE
jgi:hypothetical protein